MIATKQIKDLLSIMARLRDPETGCPWDIEQDFRSIAPYTIEEAYEVADAIERDDMVDLKDELGDLLLQVVYHSQMANEAGHFDFGDVVEAVSRKMIRRHPHVFGDAGPKPVHEVNAMWDDIKAEERAEKRQAKIAAGLPTEVKNGPLGEVPRALPALSRAEKLQKRAAAFGFDWPEVNEVLDKIEEEIGELRAAIESGDKSDRKDELGDVIFALVNLGRHLKIDAEDALRGTNRKFVRRLTSVEKAVLAAGSSLDEASLDEMEEAWKAAKEAEKLKS
ncbi:nucleoside triphosphate pyrophosphohydrolase [Notoacmeibacter sp. MSK16QG-6]|uniref:nucleoside triphosphate pyrophosphohydrolase n=1 Tax=Notoacmeibacter sp. MSK16QG-6 TaxID=2957982 RepID=UPI00209F00E7|nr:nucleoside triphosphate pyrophosphohydrolase [Notoacmeibacter sp. MSK16QG-6]MCP1200752.1 nucleoside triphosphate pyrophosphohydrolase [Notoacmeibacter sp. MSK16QG-6]